MMGEYRDEKKKKKRRCAGHTESRPDGTIAKLAVALHDVQTAALGVEVLDDSEVMTRAVINNLSSRSQLFSNRHAVTWHRQSTGVDRKKNTYAWNKRFSFRMMNSRWSRLCAHSFRALRPTKVQ